MTRSLVRTTFLSLLLALNEIERGFCLINIDTTRLVAVAHTVADQTGDCAVRFVIWFPATRHTRTIHAGTAVHAYLEDPDDSAFTHIRVLKQSGSRSVFKLHEWLKHLCHEHNENLAEEATHI